MFLVVLGNPGNPGNPGKLVLGNPGSRMGVWLSNENPHPGSGNPGLFWESPGFRPGESPVCSVFFVCVPGLPPSPAKGPQNLTFGSLRYKLCGAVGWCSPNRQQLSERGLDIHAVLAAMTTNFSLFVHKYLCYTPQPSRGNHLLQLQYISMIRARVRTCSASG